VPSIIVPFFAEQPFWADRVAMLGVGIGPLGRKTLTAARLAGAIDRAISDKGLRERAAAIGEQIRGEDGVARAVEIIEGYARKHGIAATERTYA
jgi:UDP:flavonoid glycosyltransferase YjiC (YdhE family)